MSAALKRILELSAEYAAACCMFLGLALALPFWIVGAWLGDKADDLRGGWRRGRKQNWLWRWAFGQRGKP